MLDFNIKIRWHVVEEMASRAPGQQVSVGTAVAFGGDAEAAARILPERRAWIASTSFEQKVSNSGIDGFLFDRFEEVPSVVEALRMLGLEQMASNLASVLAALALRSPPGELPEGSGDRWSDNTHILEVLAIHGDCSREVWDTDWARLRLEHAMRHAPIFFRSS